MSSDRAAWLARPANDSLARRLRWVAWGLTAVVLLLAGMMRRPEFRIALPDGWDLGFLPAVNATLNSVVSVALVVAVVAVKRGRIGLHRAAMTTALVVSVAFLLCYVAYHFTAAETLFGDADGNGVVDPAERGEVAFMRPLYLVLLGSHIVLAAVSLPFILLTFIAAWTNRFEVHRRLARRVFPVWLYVAVTGPVCYFMLRPYYG